ncbi:hypothetical protein ACFHW2_11950 [Actinomadura sp. LOL_016]|uniref:hypothetical protein n=1 Tax=unclassified Actinomadura TaxID=2626254 RepID=UPI003A8123B5
MAAPEPAPGGVPAPVADLWKRVKHVERSDGSWPGSDVVDVVTAWFVEHGLDPDTDDGPHVYRRRVEVECISPFALDEDDLDAAIVAAVTGAGVRAEHADTLDTTWVELEALGVTRAER